MLKKSTCLSNVYSYHQYIQNDYVINFLDKGPQCGHKWVLKIIDYQSSHDKKAEDTYIFHFVSLSIYT